MCSFRDNSKELQEMELSVTGVAAFRTAGDMAICGYRQGDCLSDLWTIEVLLIRIVVLWFVVVGFRINMCRLLGVMNKK